MELPEGWVPALTRGEVWVPTQKEWIEELALHELRSACEANDIGRVRDLYSKPPYDGILDFCLEDSTPNVALLRCLLENGASPDEYAKTEAINSTDTRAYRSPVSHCLLQILELRGGRNRTENRVSAIDAELYLPT